MKTYIRTLLVLVALLCAGTVSAHAAGTDIAVDESHFPDATFRAYVQKYIDRNGDGTLSQSECDQVTKINVTRYGITTLEGLQFFRNLKNLDCTTNYLTKLDLSGCPSLEYLTCRNNSIVSLDLSGMSSLIEVNCKNNLTLTSMNLDGCTSLTKVMAWECGFTEFDANPAINLKDLGLAYNPVLSKVNVDGCTQLESLNCHGGSVTELDVRNCKQLKKLYCSANRLTSLDLSENPLLTYLACYLNQITDLNIRSCTKLETLFCYENKLAELDVSDFSALKDLSCSDNLLTSLDVSGCISLDALRCQNSQLTELDTSGLRNLTRLWCDDNSISELNITGCTALEQIWARRNWIEALDVSNCPALKMLWYNGNPITSLDLSRNFVLTDVTETADPYMIQTADDNTFDLTKLPGHFDVRKASNWIGGSVSGTILTIDPAAEEVLYSYDCGNNHTATFSLIPAAAETTSDTVVIIRVNGKVVHFPDGQPYVDENNRTLIPVRFVSEKLGAEVQWDDSTRSAIISEGDIEVVITIGSPDLKVTTKDMVKTVRMDTAAVVKDGRTYVPIRFVAEALRASVNYNSARKTVSIYG